MIAQNDNFLLPCVSLSKPGNEVYHGLNFLVFLKCIYEILTSKVFLREGRPFRRGLGFENRALVIGMSSLREETPESSFGPSVLEHNHNCVTQKRSLTRLCWHSSLGLTLPELREINFGFLQASSLLLYRVVQAK